MPDVGRFFNVDPLSEKYAYQSHYNFSENRVTDYRELEGLEGVDIHWDGYDHNHGDFWNAINFNWNLSFSSGGNDNSASNNVDNSSHNENLDVGIVENVGPDYGEASTESNFAEVGVLIHVGEGISWAELGEGVKIGAELRVLSAAGLWALLLNGDAAAEKDIENDPSYITLYRGVSAGHTDYLNAIKGEAHPYDYYSTTTPEGHNGGNYKSAFTSWTISPSVANYHANKNGPMGIVLIKRFPLKNTIPSPDEYDELEVLIRGSVYGALPTRPTGPGTPTAY